MKFSRLSSLLTCAALVMAGCSDSSSDSASSDPTTTAVADETTTTVAPETTTTIAATTTSEPPPPLTLRNDGIGPFFYGDDPGTVVAGLAEQLGEPASDISTDYVEPTGGGYFFNTDHTYNFIFQFGRETCWTLGLCVSFGGVDSVSATFVGWRYEGDPAATLATDAGLTLGSRFVDHPELPAPFTCFSGMGPSGEALYDGVSWIVGDTVVGGPPNLFAILASEGVPFDEVSDDASGTGTPFIPPADVIIVKRLRAGEVPSDVATYCP